MEYLIFQIYFNLLFLLCGACVGSFLNVVIYRLPKGAFLSKVRSCCPFCDANLRAVDLIPIVSFFLLKGRCRYCGTKIALQYPLIEAAGAVAAVICFWRFSLGLQFLLAFYVLSLLLAVAVIDGKFMEIPDSLVFFLLLSAFCAVWVWRQTGLVDRVIGFFAVSLPMLAITLAVSGAFGGGDIKLMAVCGFLLGWQNVILAFFIAVLTGGGYAAYLLASGKAKRGAVMAFGPYLCTGVAVALLGGREIICFYLDFFP